jgi:DNA polymerase IIIc chi subunit
MIIFNFYKLPSAEDLISSISLICNKILDSDEKAIIKLNSKENLESLDEKLWTFSSGEFLPHMSVFAKEFSEYKEEVPVLLSLSTEKEIEAENLIILNPLENIEDYKSFKRIFFLFESAKEEELKQARDFWKSISSLDASKFTCSFYEQSEDRKWLKKN